MQRTHLFLCILLCFYDCCPFNFFDKLTCLIAVKNRIFQAAQNLSDQFFIFVKFSSN